MLSKLKRRIRKKKVCKAVHYNCSECIYRNHVFDGLIFRGTECLLERGYKNAD